VSGDPTRSLLTDARDAAGRAYAPYSNFRVGAVAVDAAGNRYLGANVENAAYGSTICAEATAIVTAATQGVRKLQTVVVACLDGADCYPCGNCRQLLREFEVEQIIVEGADGTVHTHTLEDLLPHSFGPEALDSGT